ncbi:MAG: TIGR00282 family metallophosphoesterase [Leptospirillum sp.]|jgi:hypothetical protein
MPVDELSHSLSWIVVVGDVFGRPGRKALSLGLKKIASERSVVFTVINGENLAGGKGLNTKTVHECFDMGVSVITTGNHLFDQKGVIDLLQKDGKVLRPLNYSSLCPGVGSGIYSLDNGLRIGVLNLIGRVFMAPSDCPFQAADEVLAGWRDQGVPPDLVLVDFHGEASGEKRAMGFHLDGRVSAMYGTHTHVQTNDLERLPGGSWYLTDVGLSGPHWSVIGVSPEMALSKYRTHVPAPFTVGEGELLFCALLLGISSTPNGAHIEKAEIFREVFL